MATDANTYTWHFFSLVATPKGEDAQFLGGLWYEGEVERSKAIDAAAKRCPELLSILKANPDGEAMISEIALPMEVPAEWKEAYANRVLTREECHLAERILYQAAYPGKGVTA